MDFQPSLTFSDPCEGDQKKMGSIIWGAWRAMSASQDAHTDLQLCKASDVITLMEIIPRG